jgi:hypothetical protein
VALTDLRLGDRTVHIQAEGEDVKVDGLDEMWQC